MAQSFGWYVNEIDPATDTTTDLITPGTISTDETDAGTSLEPGEFFVVEGVKYAYAGTAQAGKVNGFYATADDRSYFFSKSPAGNEPVAYGKGGTDLEGGWFISRIDPGMQATTDQVTEGNAISTEETGAGEVLEKGESFVAGDATYTYLGTARAGEVDGFHATLDGETYFFSKEHPAADERVEFGDGDTVTCFYPGTLIRTPDGDRPVEALRAGDLVLTHGGGAAPVRWMGRQTVSTVFGDPLRVLPVRIAAGALAEGLPARDLLVSPDHAILVDGVLAQAGALVNGTTVRRERGVPPRFTYHHVELAEHSLILAEGVPAETFVDNVGRQVFDNRDEHEALRAAGGSAVREMDLPRAKSRRQLPAAVRERLAERALALLGAAGAAA